MLTHGREHLLQLYFANFVSEEMALMPIGCHQSRRSCHPRATDKKVLQRLGWVQISNQKLLIGKNIPASFTDKEVF